jgi:dCMP deaminase
MNNWDRRIYTLAAHISAWSKDENRKVGAVITTSNYIVISTGYNGYPRGINDSEPLYKNEKTIHAEINALLNLRQREPNLRMYIYGGYPCSNCAACIIQYPISYICCSDIEPNSSWYENMIIANSMLEEAGIKINVYKK